MANFSPGGKKAKGAAQLTQRWRTAVLGCFDCVEKDGKLISEILAEEFIKNPMKFMELASKGIIKESTADVTLYRASDLTDDELADIATGRSKGTDNETPSKTKVH